MQGLVSFFRQVGSRGFLSCSNPIRGPQSLLEAPHLFCFASKIFCDATPDSLSTLPFPFCPEVLAVSQMPSACPHLQAFVLLPLPETRFPIFYHRLSHFLCLQSSFSEKCAPEPLPFMLPTLCGLCL